MRLLTSCSLRNLFLFEIVVLRLPMQSRASFILQYRSSQTKTPRSAYLSPPSRRSFSKMDNSASLSRSSIDALVKSSIQKVQDIIGTDAGGRGMKSLVVDGDLQEASKILAGLPVGSNIIVLSGFPCCVNETPPTETDGPPGAVALARAGVMFGHCVTLLTDKCNHEVFAAAIECLDWNKDNSLLMESFPSHLSQQDETRLRQLAGSCNLLLACERAGPTSDGSCYTMRGIDMTKMGLIAPLHRLVEKVQCPFLAIGDGGNELGMGKVYDSIVNNPKILNGSKIGCTIAADHLIAASVSNWGGYALAAGAALVKAKRTSETEETLPEQITYWVGKCLPTEEEEVALLQRCVDVGCRDGVSGKVEATVDGMPLERSMQCLRDIRALAFATCDSS